MFKFQVQVQIRIQFQGGPSWLVDGHFGSGFGCDAVRIGLGPAGALVRFRSKACRLLVIDLIGWPPVSTAAAALYSKHRALCSERSAPCDVRCARQGRLAPEVGGPLSPLWKQGRSDLIQMHGDVSITRRKSERAAAVMIKFIAYSVCYLDYRDIVQQVAAGMRRRWAKVIVMSLSLPVPVGPLGSPGGLSRWWSSNFGASRAHSPSSLCKLIKL